MRAVAGDAAGPRGVGRDRVSEAVVRLARSGTDCVDRPGTEEDQALFRVITDVGSEELLLIRSGDSWTTPGPI